MNPFALIYLLAHMTPAVIGFLAMILYSHLLSPAEYGVYVIGLSGAGVISAIFFTWVRLSVSRYQARTPDVDLRHVAAMAYAVTALVISVATPIAILIIRPNISFEILAGSLFLSLTLSAFEITQEFRRAKLNPARFATLAIVRSTLGLGLGLAAIYLGGGGIGLLVGVAASFLIANLATYLRTLTRSQRLYSSEYLPQFARYGLPFSLGAITFALHNSLDRLGIAYLLGESAAGQYGLAAEMSRQLIGILGASAASAMFPIAFRTLAESGPAATRARLAEGARTHSRADCAGRRLAGDFRRRGRRNAAWRAISDRGRNGSAAACPRANVRRGQSIVSASQLPACGKAVASGRARYAAACCQHRAAVSADARLRTGRHGRRSLDRRSIRHPRRHRVVAESLSAAVYRRGGNARICGTAFMAVVTYAAKTASAGHGLTTLVSVALLGGVGYAGAAILFNVAGIRADARAVAAPKRADRIGTAGAAQSGWRAAMNLPLTEQAFQTARPCRARLLRAANGCSC